MPMVPDPAEKTPRDPEPRRSVLNSLLAKVKALEPRFEARDRRIQELTSENRKFHERMRDFHMKAKIIVATVTAVVYLLVALATKDMHGLTYGPYPLPIATAILCLIALAVTVVVAKDWMCVPLPEPPLDPDAPAPDSNWTRWQYAILIGLTLVTCRLVHQEIHIWSLNKGRSVFNSPHRLHNEGHKLVRDTSGREVMEIHLDGPLKRDLQTRFVFHEND
jgi:hypothetical protein